VDGPASWHGDHHIDRAFHSFCIQWSRIYPCSTIGEQFFLCEHCLSFNDVRGAQHGARSHGAMVWQWRRHRPDNGTFAHYSAFWPDDRAFAHSAFWPDDGTFAYYSAIRPHDRTCAHFSDFRVRSQLRRLHFGHAAFDVPSGRSIDAVYGAGRRDRQSTSTMVAQPRHGEHCQRVLSSSSFHKRRVTSYGFRDKFSRPHQDGDCYRVTHTTHRNPDSEPVQYKHLNCGRHHGTDCRSLCAVYSVSARNDLDRRHMVCHANFWKRVQRVLYSANWHSMATKHCLDGHQRGGSQQKRIGFPDRAANFQSSPSAAGGQYQFVAWERYSSGGPKRDFDTSGHRNYKQCSDLDSQSSGGDPEQ